MIIMQWNLKWKRDVNKSDFVNGLYKGYRWLLKTENIQWMLEVGWLEFVFIGFLQTKNWKS